MVSLLTPAEVAQADAPPAPPAAAAVAPPGRRRHRQKRSRFDPYPFDPFLRNLVRLPFAVPSVLLAILADAEESVTLTGN